MGPPRCHPGRPAASWPFAFLLGLPTLPSAPQVRARGVSWCYRPPCATLPQPRPPSHPMVATPAAPRARPCQNTSLVPEPEAVGAAAPQRSATTVVQDGDRGHPGLGLAAVRGLGHGGAQWAAHGDTGACATAGPWGGGWLHRGVRGAHHLQGAGAGESGGPANPAKSPTSPRPAAPALGEPLHLHHRSPRLSAKPRPQPLRVPVVLWVQTLCPWVGTDLLPPL